MPKKTAKKKKAADRYGKRLLSDLERYLKQTEELAGTLRASIDEMQKTGLLFVEFDGINKADDGLTKALKFGDSVVVYLREKRRQ